MKYPTTAIRELPHVPDPIFQHVIETYASETNKTYSIWTSFPDSALDFQPDAKSSSVAAIMRHQLLSERRFFAEFLATPEAPAAEVVPPSPSVAAYSARMVELARPRLAFLANQPRAWWLERVRFFDVERERIWVFWRRVLHTAHHRTQLTVYQRLLGLDVLPTYGPTADVSWDGADPTHTVEAAARG